MRAALVLLALLVALLAWPALAEPAPLLIQAEAQTAAPACDGRDAQVEGNHNVLRLGGVCRSLLLRGVGNEVSLALAAGGTIRVEGSGNRVSYHAPDMPGVVALGPDNLVTAASPAGPLPAAASLSPAASLPVKPSSLASPSAAPLSLSSQAVGALSLSGDDQARAVGCAGRDVTIHGQRGLYVLSGGCRSVTVRGDLLSVQAELAPGAAVTVVGQGTRVGWALARPGRAPAVSVRGEASQAARLPPP